MKICCTGNGITKWILLEEIEKIWTWTTTYMKDCYCLFCEQNFLQIIYKEYTWYFQPLVFFLLSRSSFFIDFWLKLYANLQMICQIKENEKSWIVHGPLWGRVINLIRDQFEFLWMKCLLFESFTNRLFWNELFVHVAQWYNSGYVTYLVFHKVWRKKNRTHAEMCFY